MSLPLSYLNLRQEYTVTAVRLSSQTEIASGKPRLHRWIIDPHDPVFRLSNQNLSDISVAIDLPLVARKTSSPANDLLTDDGAFQYHNDRIEELFAQCSMRYEVLRDPKFEFGVVPPYWTSLDTEPEQGVIIARADRQPLLPQHVAAILAFASRQISLEFREYRIGSTSWRFSVSEDPRREDRMLEDRKKVMASINRRAFAGFWGKYQEGRVKGLPGKTIEDEVKRWSTPIEEWTARPEWKELPSPWDV